MLTTSFPRFQGDSAGIFVYHLARAMNGAGHRVNVVAPWDDRAAVFEEMQGILIHRFKYSPWKRLNMAYGAGGIPEKIRTDPAALSTLPLFTVSFMARAAEIAADCHIIHAHWLYSGLVAGMLRKILEVPVVLTLRGSDMKLMHSHRILWPAAMLSFALVDRVTSVSASLEGLARGMGLREDKIETIPNGVDFSLFSPAPMEQARALLGLPSDKRIILFVGNLTENKGLLPLLRAFQLVRQRRRDVLLTLVGHGPLQAELKQKALQYGLKDCALFAGPQVQSQLPFWYNSADLAVLPSFSEGRPNVVLEAMACGKPVVASDIPGIRELASEGSAVSLFRPGDSARMAEAILKVIKEPARENDQQMRKHLMDLGLTWERCAERYIECYRRARKDAGCAEGQ